MKLYTYYDSGKADYYSSGEGACFFVKLSDAKNAAAAATCEGEVVEIDLVDIGPVTRELTLRILNGIGVVKNRVRICTVSGLRDR